MRGRVQPASGALAVFPSDISTEKFLIECKSTEKASIRLQKAWWLKVRREALSVGKSPVVALEIDGERLMVISEDDFCEITNVTRSGVFYGDEANTKK